jgi:hypothetical protein
VDHRDLMCLRSISSWGDGFQYPLLSRHHTGKPLVMDNRWMLFPLCNSQYKSCGVSQPTHKLCAPSVHPRLPQPRKVFQVVNRVSFGKLEFPLALRVVNSRLTSFA